LDELVEPESFPTFFYRASHCSSVSMSFPPMEMGLDADSSISSTVFSLPITSSMVRSWKSRKVSMAILS
jgi:hypothetical protein